MRAHAAVLTDAKPDVLVLCNPLKAMPEILGALKPLIDPSVTTLTDVAASREWSGSRSGPQVWNTAMWGAPHGRQ